MTEPIIKIENLNKTFVSNNQEKPVLKNIDLAITVGEFISIIGPSGCGKSTLLRIIGGLDTEFKGTVQFENKPITGPGRERGFIFQDHRLLPWLTVEENIKFSLPESAENVDDIVSKNLEIVGLHDVKKNYPRQLSGGMAQRVAIARALSNQPKLLLLDEPFGALDAITKIHLQEEMLRLWELEHITMIIVTHDIDEAVYLGQRVIVMNTHPGSIKHIYNVEQSVPRSRTSPDFHCQRDKIYQEFFEEKSQTFFYNI
ncbi:ABC transporter ATP-binding protein [Pectinatus frisingensis]|uniref:ABC transporter ATP-binding protein n=1 Tax=Pectinatus frisingensis TaxID=865 RepID=UPI0018C53A77|nr:ABC transporter ATP-binding protein [Pectinatus frisingensis]